MDRRINLNIVKAIAERLFPGWFCDDAHYQGGAFGVHMEKYDEYGNVIEDRYESLDPKDVADNME